MTNEELLAELKRRQSTGTMPASQPAAMMPPPAQPAPMMQPPPQPAPVMQSPMQWAPQQPVLPQPAGFSVPITLRLQGEEATCYVHFSADAAQNPQALVEALVQAGWPVKTWAPKRDAGYDNRGGSNRGRWPR